MASTKSSIGNVGQILGKIPSSFTFQDPQLVDVPNTTIFKLNGSPRQIPDLSKTIRPSLGVEPILAYTPVLLKDEVGPNGERVYAQQDFDPRIRFVGNWTQESEGFGATIITNIVNNYIEVVFYGTGLVFLTLIDATARDIRVTIDGGAESADVFVEGHSVLNNRNYRTHQKILLTPTPLALGVHTAKIRFVASNNIRYYGVEVLNESSQIKIQPGEIFSNGLKYTNAELQSIDYGSGFDGNPVLNGRGGRVIEYLKQNGTVGKAIQQANSVAQYGDLADHANEELIRTINFREFGANRADDPMTLTDAVENVAFTLQDNSTSLVGDDARSFANANFPTENFYLNAINDTGATITFFGTGLDLVMTFGSAPETVTIKVDGVVVGTLTFDTLTQYKLKKIVSGLPVGSHTVSILRGGPLLANFAALHEILIYGPKAPTIPDNSINVGEYYLLGSFDYSNVTGLVSTDNLKMPKGVISKSPLREVNYYGTGWSIGGVSDIDNDHTFGLLSSTTTAADYMEYLFWGTGIEVHLCTSATGTYVSTIAIDGVNNASGTVSGNIVNSGAGAYTTNSTVIQQPARVVFTGLTLGYHKIRVTRTSGAGSMNVDSFNVIAPIYYPDKSNKKAASMSTGVQLKTSEVSNNKDLSKAKAWIVFDGVGGGIIEASYNVAGLLRNTTGQYIIFFEKPFKTDKYVSTYMSSTSQGFITAPGAGGDPNGKKPASFAFTTTNTTGTINDAGSKTGLAFFGELEEED